MSLSQSFQAEVVYGATATADVEVAVTHNLGDTPVEAFVVGLDKSAILYRGTTAWTSTAIYVRSSVVNTGFTLYVIGTRT